MKKNAVSAKKLVEAYKLYKNGMHPVDVYYKTHVASAHLIEDRCKRWVNGSNKEKEQYRNYVEAYHLLVKENLINENHYTLIRKATDQFNAAVVTFIEVEVNKRVENIKLENLKILKENEELKKTIEEMQTIVDQAKNSNWIDSLRRKFSN